VLYIVLDIDFGVVVDDTVSRAFRYPSIPVLSIQLLFNLLLTSLH